MRTTFKEQIAKLIAEKKIDPLLVSRLRDLANKRRVKEISFAQEQLLFLDQLEPGSSAYIISAAMCLSGPLRIDVLERALSVVIERHEVLRTHFEERDGTTIAVIDEAQPFILPIVDLADMADDEVTRELQVLGSAEMLEPFDLQRGPLLRAQLIRLGSQKHVLSVAVHHIVADGWSMGILVREVASLYTAFYHDSVSPLPALPIQYGDFAAWQRQWLSGEELEQQLSYWREHLDGAPTSLELPADRSRPPIQRYRGATHTFTISAPLAKQLRLLATQESATLFMVLLAAFQIVLARWSGQNDIVVGTPIAGRSRSSVSKIIGLFVNTLAIRTNLEGDPSFRTLLSRVREAALGAYAHQDLPFEKVVEALRPPRDLSRHPIFQVMLNLLNLPPLEAEMPELDLQPLAVPATAAKFDLNLKIADEADGALSASMEYATDLYDEETVARMASHLITALEKATANPDDPLSNIELIGRTEREQLVRNWNDTSLPLPHGDISSLFIEQALKTPNAVAVVFEDRNLTYEDLDRRSNRMARHLIALGVGPETVVGLCMERSPEMIVVLLAVLKAGGAYLALDPTYPADRLVFMLTDAKASILVTQRSLTELLCDYEGEVVVCDADLADIESIPDSPLLNRIQPNSLAYVIYTSGSTGKPKGIMTRHEGLHSYFRFLKRTYGIGADDVILNVSSCSFDPSARDIFGTLLSGARLIMAPATDISDPDRFISLLEKTGVTMLLSIVPTLLREVCRSAVTSTSKLKLQTIMSAGEPLDVGLRDAVVESFGPQINLVNQYGPTECVMASSYHRVSNDEAYQANIPIGVPVDNVQLYVMDDWMRVVPIGVPGQLYIGGVGLARGYIGRPDLTADRFVPNPFTYGERLYRTGDLARWRADGVLEYLGRIDHQVKIRGFRIEPREIEAALEREPDVRQALVIALKDRKGDPSLVAYVVADNGQILESATLRTKLAECLPDYMLPSAFVMMDAFPLTPTGKLDRAGLPRPDIRPEFAYVAPVGGTQESLAAIWADVLGISNVGVHDDFFALGGHSLLAARAITRIRREFDVEVALRNIFVAPTVATLAAQIDHLLSTQKTPEFANRPLKIIDPAERGQIAYAQERLLFLDQLEPGSSAYIISAAMCLSGPLRIDVLERALSVVIERHEVLRTHFEERDGTTIAVIDEAQPFILPIVDLADMADDEVTRELQVLGSAEMLEPFDLQRGPLLRAQLIRLGSQKHVLSVAVHHIVADGWSMGILVREVASLYTAFYHDSVSPLPALPIQYGDFAAWQRQWLSGEELEQQLSYWREHLDGAPTSLELPADRSRPPIQRYRGATHTFTISAPLAKQLRLLATQESATLFMVLLAAFQIVLARWSGQNDIVVGTPIAGRSQIETERLIGLFVNTLAIRTNLEGDPSFRTLLSRVREAALGAYAHQDLPFEKVVEALRPPRDLSRHPIFQVMLNLLNLPPLEAEMPELDLQPLAVPATAAKFDLNLKIADEADGALSASMEYATDLYDEETVARMASHLITALEKATANPDDPLSNIELIGRTEREQLQDEWIITFI